MANNSAVPAADPLFISKLASSGLSASDAANLGMQYHPDCSSLHASFQAVPGFTLPYFDINGNQTQFYRIRYLATMPGFAAQVAKPQRYAQTPGSLNEVYLPPMLPWADIAKRPTDDIIITEGELKAACAALHGHICMALGGVSTWSSAKRNVALLEPLPHIDWRGRAVIILFDSDAATNPNVAKAQIALAKMLLAQGAMPKIATLPPSKTGEKQGLDDFIMAGGDVNGVLLETRSLELGDRMLEINNQFAYVADQDLVVEIDTGRRLKRDAFTNGLLANHTVVEYVAGSNGNTKRVELRVASEWLKWASRKDVERFTYEPGGEPITVTNEYNTWHGWGCKPSEGAVQPWHELLDLLFDSFADARTWFERWLAYPLQHPGHKLFTSAVLWGPETGTGKSLIGYTMKEIYGENFGEIGNQELHSSFNEWAINKQFIMGDEITGSDKRHEADKLKALITQRQLRINMKNMPTYTVPDCINYYFTSNHPDAFFIDDLDRRFFIWRTMAEKRREASFYDQYIRWLRTDGRSALFNYFLNLDLGDFNPSAPAPSTSSKHELIDHARSDLSAWVSYFMSNMDIELEKLAEYTGTKPENLDLVLNSHIKWLYDPNNVSRVTNNGLGRELSRFGMKTLPPVTTQSFGSRRFYVLRNYKHWSRAQHTEIVKYIDKAFPPAINKEGKF